MSKQISIPKIKQIGIELEGAWITQPSHESLQCHGDGSVSVTTCKCGARDRGEACRSSECCRYVGEVVSIPLNSIDEAVTWLDTFYPKISNKTCGMHIHVSLIDKLSYMRLMSRTFYNYFLTRVTAWGVEKKINEGTIFWERLTGQNRYCLKKFIPEAQIKHTSKGGERYTHLNYCYGVHQTIECRLFPTFQKKELSLSALKLYADIIETFLAKTPREKTIEEVILDEEEPKVMGELICVS